MRPITRVAAFLAAIFALLSMLAVFAEAQCSSGSCGASGLQRATSDTDLKAQGFRLVLNENGRRVWSRPMAPVTQLAGCSGGDCGSTAIRPRVSDWNPAPRRDTPAQAPQAQPPKTTPAVTPSTQPQIDLDKLANTLAEKLAADPRFKGPKGDSGDAGPPGAHGERGPAGPAGPQGADGKEATVDYDQIVAAVLNRLDYDAIAELVIIKTPANSSEVHYVVVGDNTASYWPRVSQSLRRAKESYHGIAESRPPENYTGPLPVIVKYTNGVPEYVARGESEVTTALTYLAQGKAP